MIRRDRSSRRKRLRQEAERENPLHRAVPAPGAAGRLAGLLLGQLDAFNRIATTFGHEECETFCAQLLGAACARSCRRARRSSGCPSAASPCCSTAIRCRAVMDIAVALDRGQSAAARSRWRPVSRRRHARHRGVSVACRRCRDAVPPCRARAQGSAREGARVRHLSARRDAAAGRAVEIRVRAAERRRSAASSRSITSRRSRSPRVGSAVSKRWCAGARESGSFVPAERFHPARRDATASSCRSRGSSSTGSSSGSRSWGAMPESVLRRRQRIAADSRAPGVHRRASKLLKAALDQRNR